MPKQQRREMMHGEWLFRTWAAFRLLRLANWFSSESVETFMKVCTRELKR